jgi:hypothetical protein
MSDATTRQNVVLRYIFMCEKLEWCYTLQVNSSVQCFCPDKQIPTEKFWPFLHVGLFLVWTPCVTSDRDSSRRDCHDGIVVSKRHVASFDRT